MATKKKRMDIMIGEPGYTECIIHPTALIPVIANSNHSTFI